MSSHQASAQMLGYLYQVRCALALLLSADSEQTAVCMEKFDDIAFSDDGSSPIELIQLKHHINGHGDLSDSSVDLWRTLNVWMDAVADGVYPETRYLIITTSSAPEGSVASALKTGGEDCAALYERLKKTATLAAQKTNTKFYEKFLKTAPEKIQRILTNISILDGSTNIIDVVDSIKKSIRYAAQAKYIDRVFERVEGWWFKKSIEALISKEPVFISQSEVRLLICDIAAQYTPDNLPTDAEPLLKDEVLALPITDRMFCKQLKLISIGKKRMEICIGDFFRASTQRSRWVQDDLLCIDELDRYEGKLVDEWQHRFARMQDELDEDDENTKRIAGRKLFSEIEDRDIRIRIHCADAFIMRGSYHILSNNLKVGWHPDYEHCLQVSAPSEEELK